LTLGRLLYWEKHQHHLENLPAKRVEKGKAWPGNLPWSTNQAIIFPLGITAKFHHTSPCGWGRQVGPKEEGPSTSSQSLTARFMNQSQSPGLQTDMQQSETDLFASCYYCLVLLDPSNLSTEVLMAAFQSLQGSLPVCFAKHIHVSQNKTFSLGQGKVDNLAGQCFSF
jgi:hypothetical protein